MTTTTSLLAAALALALATPLAAQDTTAPADEQTQDQAPAAAATDAPADAPAATGDAPAIDMGTPVGEDPAAPRDGQPYVSEEHGDWQVRCLHAPEGQDDPCQLYQLLYDSDENPVSEVTIVPLPAGSEAAAGAVIVVPLETQLDAGLIISIDGGEARRYEYDFCNRAGCVARFGLSTDQVAQFRRGTGATVTIVPAQAPDQRVVLPLSLAGFTAGFEAVPAAAAE